jgi:hypothetical protein
MTTVPTVRRGDRPTPRLAARAAAGLLLPGALLLAGCGGETAERRPRTAREASFHYRSTEYYAPDVKQVPGVPPAR